VDRLDSSLGRRAPDGFTRLDPQHQIHARRPPFDLSRSEFRTDFPHARGTAVSIPNRLPDAISPRRVFTARPISITLPLVYVSPSSRSIPIRLPDAISLRRVFTARPISTHFPLSTSPLHRAVHLDQTPGLSYYGAVHHAVQARSALNLHLTRSPPRHFDRLRHEFHRLDGLT
jgi:hypothetical protein